EVVKLNHNRNCLVCHAPATRGDEPVVGVDPTWTMPGPSTTNPVLIQAIKQTAALEGWDYAARKAAGLQTTTATVGGRSLRVASVPVPVLVRADITFLRQDFSVTLPVAVALRRLPRGGLGADVQPAPGAPAGLAPTVRFDYAVRSRPIDQAEQKRWRALKEEGNPQRDAALFALRELTGPGHGPETQARGRG